MIDDFNFIYPGKANSLFEAIPLYKTKILELAKIASDKLRDYTLKGILNEYLNQTSGT